MKKGFAGLVLSAVMIFSMTGCGDSAGFGEFSAKDAIKIEDIDWITTESILDGERIVSFNYTNKSKYTILDVEMEFTQKPDVTKEQMSAFDDYIEWRELTDEEINEIYILGYNRKVAEPNETVTDSPCCIDGTFTYVESASQLEAMEPNMVTIVFEGKDKKGYTIYYDFKSKTYSEATQGGIDLHQWSESEFAKQIPKMEAAAVTVNRDDEKEFYFRAFGISQSDYTNYVEAVKQNGFDNINYERDTRFDATSSNGNEITCTYTPIDEELSVRLYQK